MSGVSELASKLDSYKSQLRQIQELLVTKPNDETLTKLRDDLKEVISLTEKLTSEKSDKNKPKCIFDLGQKVCAKFPDGKWYVAKIESIHLELSACSIRNLEVEQPLFDVAFHHCKEYELVLSPLAVGDQIRAIFAGDGMFYDAEINKILPKNRLLITFTEYGDQEEVSVNDIQLPKGAKKKVVASKDSLQKPNLDYLKPKATDTPEVAASKLRRLKSIKNNQRQERLDGEINDRASKWQAFNNNANKKQKLMKSKASETVEVDESPLLAISSSKKQNNLVLKNMKFSNIPDTEF